MRPRACGTLAALHMGGSKNRRALFGRPFKGLRVYLGYKGGTLYFGKCPYGLEGGVSGFRVWGWGFSGVLNLARVGNRLPPLRVP